MKIAIYVDNEAVYDYPFSERRYRESYSDLVFELDGRGNETRIVREGSYLGNGVFSGSFRFSRNSDRDLEENGQFEADIIFDKGDRSTLRDDGHPKINKRELEDLCNNKQKTTELFESVSPKTKFVDSREDLAAALKTIPGEVKVFKPSDGFGGDGIVIGSDEDILNNSTDEELYPALVQQFIDSSRGIDGIVEGLHDLRVIMINDTPLQASIRQPAAGSFKANIKAGGSIFEIGVSSLPKGVFDFISAIDDRMQQFGNRVYSIDMVFDCNKFYLMELNARPGWHPRSVGDDAERFIISLADMIENN